MACGGVALNYARAEQLLISARGQVCGVVLRDRAQGEDGRTAEVQARAVVNAAGPWCDGLRAKQGGKPLLREKSGSHLFLSLERLSLAGGIALPHPRDGRELRFIPWEGVVAVGATDQDYYLPEDVAEPAVSAQEVEYLLEGLAYAFPGLELGIRDVIAGHAGVMVLAEGGGLVLDESGLVTAAGGMLATFRVTAAQALNLLRERLPGLRPFEPGQAVLEMPGEMPYSGVLDPAEWSYLAGRYGRELPGLLAATPPEELTPIYPHLPFLWAELRWAARDGAVVHLDDLLLRRLRLGLCAAQGRQREKRRQQRRQLPRPCAPCAKLIELALHVNSLNQAGWTGERMHGCHAGTRKQLCAVGWRGRKQTCRRRTGPIHTHRQHGQTAGYPLFSGACLVDKAQTFR